MGTFCIIMPVAVSTNAAYVENFSLATLTQIVAGSNAKLSTIHQKRFCQVSYKAEGLSSSSSTRILYICIYADPSVLARRKKSDNFIVISVAFYTFKRFQIYDNSLFI